MSNRSRMLAVAALEKYARAIANGHVSDRDEAHEVFRANILGVQPHEFQMKLRQIQVKLNATEAAITFAEFGELMNQATPIRDAFNLGAQMAHEAEKSLFFPALAEHLSQVSVILTSLKDAAENVAGNMDAIQENISKGDVSGIFEQIQSISQTLEGVKSKMTEVESGLED